MQTMKSASKAMADNVHDAAMRLGTAAMMLASVRNAVHKRVAQLAHRDRRGVRGHNSAIDEMIPARYRGRVDIGVNGTYWAGSIIGMLVSLAFLNWIGPVLGWRLGFLAGPALAVVIVYVRRTLPESPRWLLTHGHAAEADKQMAGIEATVEQDLGKPLPPVDSSQAIEIRPAKFTGYLTLLKLACTSYWRRAVLGATLLITQSFLYNANFSPTRWC